MTRTLRVSRSAFTAMWFNPAMTNCMIARAIGSDRASTASDIASRFGLPHRSPGPKPQVDKVLLRKLWLAGVVSKDIAQMVGITRSRVSQEAARLGLPMRHPGRNKGVSIAEYRQGKAIAAMRDDAAAIRLAMLAAQVVDGQRLGSGGGAV